MSEPNVSEAELIAAIERLSDDDSLEAAQLAISSVAAPLQIVLNEALTAAEWFDEAHERQVLSAAGMADVDQRLTAVKTLLAEETRLGMFVGATIGFALAQELARAK